MSNNFGEDCSLENCENADISGDEEGGNDGVVDFKDFVWLANRFGNTGCFGNNILSHEIFVDLTELSGIAREEMVWDLPELDGFVYRGGITEFIRGITEINLRYVSPIDNKQHSEFSLDSWFFFSSGSIFLWVGL